MNMIIATICFLIAVPIGAWRQSCIIYENYHAFELGPSAWQHKSVRTITWFISSILSVVFAYIFATWIMNEVNEFAGKFSFGVLLVTRWFASSLYAVKTSKHLDEIFKNKNE